MSNRKFLRRFPKKFLTNNHFTSKRIPCSEVIYPLRYHMATSNMFWLVTTPPLWYPRLTSILLDDVTLQCHLGTENTDYRDPWFVPWLAGSRCGPIIDRPSTFALRSGTFDDTLGKITTNTTVLRPPAICPPITCLIYGLVCVSRSTLYLRTVSVWNYRENHRRKVGKIIDEI